jgi:hypothetical protein
MVFSLWNRVLDPILLSMLQCNKRVVLRHRRNETARRTRSGRRGGQRTIAARPCARERLQPPSSRSIL